MSDQPLFQNSDEEEARYAPERVPGGGPAKQSGDPDTGLIPGAIAPVSGGTLTPSAGNIFAPEAGAAGLTDMLDDDTMQGENDSRR
jgi:hypothetical protein